MGLECFKGESVPCGQHAHAAVFLLDGVVVATQCVEVLEGDSKGSVRVIEEDRCVSSVDGWGCELEEHLYECFVHIPDLEEIIGLKTPRILGLLNLSVLCPKRVRRRGSRIRYNSLVDIGHDCCVGMLIPKVVWNNTEQEIENA